MDIDYIKSKDYRKKFSGLTCNPVLNFAIYKIAKAILFHRNGTDIEDLWIISKVDPEDKHKVIGSKLEVKPTKHFLKALIKAPAETYIGIHNHPTNIPPTGSDIAAASARRYAFGIVVLHDGRVYYYRPLIPILSSRYVDAKIDKHIRRGYTEPDAMINTLDELAKAGEIEWRELV